MKNKEENSPNEWKCLGFSGNHKDLCDEEVLTLSVKKPALFEVIVDRYEEAFLRKARRIVGNRVETLDIVQEAFTRIYLNATKFHKVEGASFKSWAYKVLINVTLTWYQKLKKSREAEMPLDPELDEVIPDLDMKDRVENEGLKDYVFSVLQRMPTTLARALKGHFIEGKLLKEIADEEGVSENAIKARVFRAKREFKKTEKELEKKSKENLKNHE